MKAPTILAASALMLLAATPCFAVSLSNVFLSGKVFKGDELITTFASPIVLGNTLPVKDQVSDGTGRMSTLRLALTPEQSEDKVMSVSIKADWGTLGAPSEAVSGGTFRDKVNVIQGQSKSVSLGSCGYADDQLTKCDYKLVFSANLQR